ncbi:MAG: LAGLIDADG family homing endonuclease [Candidatus Margulisiibacteriota bacterium]|nr:LAGLIDADG family homing endonuclease [Candidatus Margulisiibacteriota bacterium]
MIIAKKNKQKAWNKGFNKETHPGVAKISVTMSAKEKTNFYEWQQKNKPKYVNLQISPLLAEFYGIMLGDGCIEMFVRTEKIVVTCFSEQVDYIKYIRRMIKRLFGKTPTVRKKKDARAIDIYFYQKYISERLDFPTGIKLKHSLKIPAWISCSQSYLVRCLKGLFETDGDFTVASKNYTYVIKFSNRSQSLLDDVYFALKSLGYHPQRRKVDVRIARKKEAYKFAEQISFRKW